VTSFYCIGWFSLFIYILYIYLRTICPQRHGQDFGHLAGLLPPPDEWMNGRTRLDGIPGLWDPATLLKIFLDFEEGNSREREEEIN